MSSDPAAEADAYYTRIDDELAWLRSGKTCSDCSNYWGYDLDKSQHAGFCTKNYEYLYEDDDASDCEYFRGKQE